ncbi:MAG: hypothetical protein GY856_43165, partial [bacterium]|nr:hypothetical protein [bacterium]
MSSGLTNWDPKITWSYDSRKIAFIDYRRLNACVQHQAFLTVIDIATSESVSGPVPGSRGCYGSACFYAYNRKCWAWPPDSEVEDPRENQLVSRHVSFFRDNRHVLIPQRGGLVVMDSFTGDVVSTGSWSHVSHAPSPHSPSGAYAAVSSNGACAAVKSLLNLTASLQVLRKDSHILLKGFATDLHFDRYTLEWADVSAPDDWRPIQPPRGTPVLDGDLGVWIPPGPGAYLVRLTVADLAGGEARAQKRVSWGRSLAIADLYKEGGVFSPNGDGVNDSAGVRYTALEPASLRFLIRDEADRVVRTITREHPSPPPGGQADRVAWDGKNDGGQTVPDGIYRLTVLDYEFVFEVDNTPPEVRVEIGRIQCVQDPDIPSKFHVFAELAGRAADRRITGWIVEVGEGDNPDQWREFLRGDGSLISPDDAGGEKIVPIKRFDMDAGDLVFPAGKRFRLTAVDAAGNRSAATSGIIEEILILGEMRNPEIDGWSRFPFTRTGAGGFEHPGGWAPVKRKDRNRILPELKIFETVRAPLTDINVSYIAHGQWVDSPPAPDPGEGVIRIPWSELGCRTRNKIMIRARDENGEIHESNPGRILCMGELPEFPNFSLTIRPPAIAPCDALSDGIIGIITHAYGPPHHPLAARYYISDQPFIDWTGEEPLLRSVDLTEENFPVIRLDTSVMAEGKYVVMLEFDFIDMDGETRRLTTNASFPVDRGLPAARIDFPDGATPVCASLTGPPGSEWPALVVNGRVSKASGSPLRSSSLYYGAGENPDVWRDAMTREGCAAGVASRPISLNHYRPDRIGAWEVSGLAGSVYSLRLKVVDEAGNTRCRETVFELDKALTLEAGVDKEMISPNGDGVLDEVAIHYLIDEEALVDLTVHLLEENDRLGPAVRAILRGESHMVGPGSAVWSGRGDDGAAVADGVYRIMVEATDACGNGNRRLAGEVEVDNTPPALAIDAPAPGDVLGVMVEIRGSATDEHLDIYRLEVLDAAGAPLQTLAEGENIGSDQTLAVWNTLGRDGIHALRLWARDELGNSAETSVTVDLADRLAWIQNLTAAPRFFSPDGAGASDLTVIHADLHEEGSARYDLRIEIAREGVTTKTFIANSIFPGGRDFRWCGEDDAGQPALDGVYTVSCTVAPSAGPGLPQTERATVVRDAAPPRVEIVLSGGAAHLASDPVVRGSILDDNMARYSVTWAGNGMAGVVDQGKRSRKDHVFGAIAGLDEGAYTLTASAWDLAGNQEKKRIDFVMDRIPPKPTLELPAPGGLFGGGAGEGAGGGAGGGAGEGAGEVEIRGAVDEENLSTWVLRYGAGGDPAAWTETAGGGPAAPDPILFTWAVGEADGIPDGPYTISLYAEDKAGWKAEARVEILVDNTAPTLTVTAPTPGQWVTGAMSVTGSVVDPHLHEYTAALSRGACADAFEWAPIKISNTGANAGVLAELGNLPEDGPYCIRLSASDRVGNHAETRTDIRVDVAPPAPPVLTASLSNRVDARLRWSGSVEPDLAGFNIYRNGVRLNTDMILPSEFTDAPPGEGAYTWRVTALDHAGNESLFSNPATLNIDLTPPAAVIHAPVRGARASDLVEIRGTAFSQEDFKQYRVYTGLGAAPSAWSLLIASPLPTRAAGLAQWRAFAAADGPHVIRLEAEDQSGNIARHEVPVEVDNTPPGPPVLLSAERPDPAAPDVRIQWETGAEPDRAGVLLYRSDRLANITGSVVGDLAPYLLHGGEYMDRDLPDGVFHYYALAMDAAGNLSAASGVLSVEIESRGPRMEITAPPDQHAFDQPLLIKAETPDRDVARVRFQWKRASEETWSDLGAPVLAPPYTAVLDPGALDLTHEAHHIRALGADHGGRTDATPPRITVHYTDVTPPAPPRDLAARMEESAVILTWTANEEPDLQGFNIHRIEGGSPVKINQAAVPGPPFSDTGRPGGDHLYEITAVDASGNESAPSNRAGVRVYTPALQPPETPTPHPEIPVSGFNAGPGDQVEFFVDAGAGPASAGIAAADDAGRFSRMIALAPGENILTVQCVNGAGGRSALSAPAAVHRAPPPAAPTGLTAVVNGLNCALSWNAGPDAAGYILHRNGERLTPLAAAAAGVATASDYDGSWCSPSKAVDGDAYTYWKITYNTPETAWWSLDLDAPEMIHRIDIDWKWSEGAARDYEIQTWSDAGWVVLEKVEGNESVFNTFDFSPPRPVDAIRVYITAVNWTMDPVFRMNEFTCWRIDPIIGESHEDAGLPNAEYVYRVSAVNAHGFEGPLSGEVRATVGDVSPPGTPRDLAAATAGADVSLTWTPGAAPDLAGYIVYKLGDEGWERKNAQLLVEAGFSDPGLRNGSHHYRVSAEDASGNESPPSDPVEALIALEPLAPPADLVVAAPPGGEVLEVSWTHEGGAAGYILYRAETAGGPHARVAPALLPGTAYTDAGLTNGVPYFYVVTAADAVGNESAPAAEASGTPRELVPPPAPTIFLPAPGEHLVEAKTPAVDVSGWAEPGADAALYINENSVGVVRASGRDYGGSIMNGSGLSLHPSPDGRLLACINASYGVVSVRDLDTGDRETLAIRAHFLTWSPDGAQILYVKRSYDSDNNRIMVYDAAGGAEAHLTDDDGAVESWPDVSPDGEKVAFISDRDGSTAIRVMETGGGAPARVAGGDVGRPLLSPDGALLAHAAPGSGALYVTDLADGSVVVADESLYIPDSGDPCHAWAPRENRLAFISTRNGAPDIYILDAETETVQRITDSDASEILLAWSPLGRRLVHAVMVDSKLRLHLVSPETPLEERRIYYYWYPDNFESLIWTPRGKIIFRDGHRNKWLLPAGHFTARDVPLEMGVNTLTAEAADASGNVSPPSDPVLLYFDPNRLPDLAIGENDIYIHPAAPVAGDRLTVTIFARNRNLAPAENTSLDVYIMDAAGRTTPVKTETIARVEPGEEEFITFSRDSEGETGEIRIMAILDADDAIRESDETNNLAVKTIRVAEAGGVTMTAAPEFDAYRSGEEVVVDVAISNSGPPESITLEARIETGDGAYFAAAGAAALLLPHGATTHRFTWSAGLAGAGAYQVRVEAAAGGEILAETVSPFRIDAETRLEASVILDKTDLGPREEVAAAIHLKNSGTEPLIPALEVRLRVVREDGAVLHTETRPIANLLQGAPARLTLRWSTGANAPGLHRVEARVFIDGQPASDALRTFRILPRVRLAGALTVTPAQPQPGETAAADYTLQNSGNAAASPLTLEAVLMDPDTLTEAAVRQVVLNLGVNESITGRFLFPTPGLALKTYWIMLRADAGQDAPGENQGLAVASFTLKDLTPPLLVMDAPRDADAFGPSDAPLLTVTARDNASGVSAVEHRVDDGDWRPLPPADPVA